MSKSDYGPISQYNSLIDPNLQGYYSKSIIRHHLRQTGLINRKGEIIPEDVWRKKMQTKERMEQASRMIASKIVQQAIEIKNLERAEIRRKLEEVSKRELVKRIRGKSLQNRHLPLLWSNKDDSFGDSNPKRVNSRSVSPQNDEDDIKVLDEYHDDDHRVFVPKPPKQKPLKKIRFRRRLGTGNRFGRGLSAQPKSEPIILTMIYYGKGIKIPFDTQVFDSKDEITIYQQHCGGENLLVYSGLHEKGDKFSFQSKRHKEYPFGLTIFLNGRYDCRISTCCEYRHNLNVRIGANGSFGITNVVGDRPCVKCLWEKNQSKPKIIRQDNDKIPKSKEEIKTKPKEVEESDEDIPVIVEKPKIIPAATVYDDDFTDQDEWLIKVYTSNLLSGSLDGDYRVYLSLIGSQGETDEYTLDKHNSKSKNKALFQAGNCDEFEIKTNTEIDQLRQIRIGLDNGRSNKGWNLEKITLFNKRNSTEYEFLCYNWLSNDTKLERILPEPKDTNKKADKTQSKLTIQMKHEPEITVKSKTPTPVPKSPSIKSRSPTPVKARTPSVESIKSRSPTPVPLNNNSRRWTASDVANGLIKVNEEERSRKTDSSRSSASSVISKSSVSSKSNKTSVKSEKTKLSIKQESESETSSESSSESSASASSDSEGDDEKENTKRKVKSVYEQLKEQEDNYRRGSAVSKQSSNKASTKDHSREPSVDSKYSKTPTTTKEPSREQSRQSNRSAVKELISASKQSLSSTTSMSSSVASSARDKSRRSSDARETKLDSVRQSKTSIRDEEKDDDRVSNHSKVDNQRDLSAKASEKPSLKSSAHSLAAKDEGISGRVSKSSQKSEASRASSKAESFKKQISVSDSESSDSSDSSTAREDAEEEDIKSNRSAQKESTNSAANIIQDVIQNHSKTSSKTPDSQQQSRNPSRLSLAKSQSNSPAAEQTALATANGSNRASPHKELSKPSSSMSNKSQQSTAVLDRNGTPTKSNSSLKNVNNPSKHENATSSSSSSSESDVEEKKPVKNNSEN